MCLKQNRFAPSARKVLFVAHVVQQLKARLRSKMGTDSSEEHAKAEHVNHEVDEVWHTKQTPCPRSWWVNIPSKQDISSFHMSGVTKNPEKRKASWKVRVGCYLGSLCAEPWSVATLTVGLVWAGLRTPGAPKEAWQISNLASISRDYSYNHSQILKYRKYIGGLEYPRKGETLYRNWPPPFPYILLYFIVASPFMSRDICLWNHPMSRMPAIFRLWREEATSSATSDSLQAIFIGFSSWYFKRWTNGEEASLWVIGKYRFIYFPSLV